jgi:hypothetical protein
MSAANWEACADPIAPITITAAASEYLSWFFIFIALLNRSSPIVYETNSRPARSISRNLSPSKCLEQIVFGLADWFTSVSIPKGAVHIIHREALVKTEFSMPWDFVSKRENAPRRGSKLSFHCSE